MAQEQSVEGATYETHECSSCGQKYRGKRIVEVSKEEYARFRQAAEQPNNFLAAWAVVVIFGAFVLAVFAGGITGITATGQPRAPWATLSWPELASLCVASVLVIICAILAWIAILKDEKASRHEVKEWKKRHGIPIEENISVRLAQPNRA